MHGMAVRALTILPTTTSWPDWQTSGHRASKQRTKHSAACRGDLQPTSADVDCCKYTIGVSDQSAAHQHQEWQITHAGCLRCTSPQRPPAADSPSLPHSPGRSATEVSSSDNASCLFTGERKTKTRSDGVKRLLCVCVRVVMCRSMLRYRLSYSVLRPSSSSVRLTVQSFPQISLQSSP